jgi:hypothetical protein
MCSSPTMSRPHRRRQCRNGRNTLTRMLYASAMRGFWQSSRPAFAPLPAMSSRLRRLTVRPLGSPGTTAPPSCRWSPRCCRPNLMATRAPVYDVGMIGSWTWAANRAGLDWFLHSRAIAAGDFRIAIAGDTGGEPPDAPDNVRFLRPGARCPCLCPLLPHHAAGVQTGPACSSRPSRPLKWDLPSVATRSALRGISVQPDNCVLAGDADDFARSLVDMVRRSRDGQELDCDGGAFHARQLEGLMNALERGLQWSKTSLTES